MGSTFRYALAAMLAALATPHCEAAAQSGERLIAVPIVPQAGPDDSPLTREVLSKARPMPMPELTEEQARRLFRGRLPPRDTATPRPEPTVRGSVAEKPLKWAGKLFHEAGDGVYYCGAQFIGPKVLVTAAHCIVDIEGNSGRLSFFLQYESGEYRREYRFVSGAYWNRWLNRDVDRWRWDYAIVCVEEGSRSGYFGYRTLWKDAYAEATAIGYPAALDGGEIIQAVAGSLTFYEPAIYELDLGTGRFKHGANGGAWIGDFSKTDGKNEVLSVNSFVLPDRRGRVYGPYFDKDFTALLMAARALGDC